MTWWEILLLVVGCLFVGGVIGVAGFLMIWARGMNW